MAAIVWLVAGILLAAAEMFVGELTLLMLGSAALLTAGVSFLADSTPVVDAVVFAVSAVVLLLGVRPVLLRRFGTPPPTLTNADALPGKTARVLEPVGEHGGLVKLGGEVWTALAWCVRVCRVRVDGVAMPVASHQCAPPLPPWALPCGGGRRCRAVLGLAGLLPLRGAAQPAFFRAPLRTGSRRYRTFGPPGVSLALRLAQDFLVANAQRHCFLLAKPFLCPSRFGIPVHLRRPGCGSAGR